MKWTGLNDLREKYLSFFESKGHTRLPSYSLIPHGDKSLLLINSGMAPMKKYFLGQETPPNVRVTTCQKCIRTPDIERVGITARHGTYFEMLGNFSFGDYFKEEAIEWAWEFLTKTLEIPADRLWITIFESDDEAEQIWEKKIGIPHDRIVRLGKADNFWEHGSGPCGPCSEIHFDRGEKYGPFESFEQASDCDRIIEIWNLVFSQFDSDGNGNYALMEKKNIDTGMGLERLACVMQDVDNLFEVDTVQNIMKHIAKIAGVEYKKNEKTDISLRVITDHIRSTTFMVGDGVTPSNGGRGYVLRRLLRRAARHGRLLGITRPFLCEVADTVINENASAYPELAEKREMIKNAIRAEEESFAKTIDKGLSILNEKLDAVKNAGGKVLSGEDVFLLSDTYGFPFDLTLEIAAEKGIELDEERFRELLAEQKKRAKDDHNAKSGSSWDENTIKVDAPATEFVGYIDYMEPVSAKVLAVFVNGESVNMVNDGDDAVIVLDKTPFYAESGGQVGDTGVLKADTRAFVVSDTKKLASGHYMHIGTAEGAISVGDTVSAQLDTERRLAVMRNHTAAHLLQNALRKVLGDHVHQAGQLVDGEKVRFDFTHFSAVSHEELAKIENLVNADILAAFPVTMTEMPIEEAKKLGAMALFGEKYGDVVRVVKAHDSIEFCGGTHIDSTAKLGLFKIVSEASAAAGVRRIEAVTGTGVLDMIAGYKTCLESSAAALKLANPSELPAKCAAVVNEIKGLEKEISDLSGTIASARTDSLISSASEVNGVKVMTGIFENTKTDVLRTMGDKVKDKYPDAVAVLAAVNGASAQFLCVCGKEALSKGAHAGKIVQKVSAVTGGKGGGRPDSAMAGAGDVSKVSEAVNSVKNIVSEFIG